MLWQGHVRNLLFHIWQLGPLKIHKFFKKGVDNFEIKQISPDDKSGPIAHIGNIAKMNNAIPNQASSNPKQSHNALL